ncbi:MAG: hypothetical protein ACJAVK_001319 [Akkermansiaceae bacterium]|jgi:hypothetical protein
MVPLWGVLSCFVLIWKVALHRSGARPQAELSATVLFRGKKSWERGLVESSRVFMFDLLRF